MTGKTVAEGMRRGPLAERSLANPCFDCLLYYGFMQMIPLILPSLRHAGKILGRKKPLPDKFLAGIWIFLVQGSHKKNPRIFAGKITPVQFLDGVKLSFKVRKKKGGKRHGPILFPFPIVNGDFPGIKIQALDAKIDTLEQTQAAT